MPWAASSTPSRRPPRAETGGRRPLPRNKRGQDVSDADYHHDSGPKRG
ncbi:hypothetical protein ACN28S_44595 [Cystobacter fuscus]